jgi:oxygen-independent coproporphyrinogen-3 oxidase
LAEDWQAGGFGLYIHWPFCQAKCPYCDFNSHVAREIDQSRWLNSYLAEIDRYAALLPGRVLNSVFFGGGTPSLMDPSLVAAILERVRQSWQMANDLEVTLEANPGSVEAGRFAAYEQGGVNRVSIGAQALNDADLRRLGRIHTVQEFSQAIDIAQRTFSRVSFDLIYARQSQTLAAWCEELRAALGMGVDHLSLYQLTIEAGTAFGARHAVGRLPGLPDDDLAADMYLATQEICAAEGLPAYEVSNHARPGAESRHNLIYWHYGDYVGIGPGAHGRITLDGQRRATEALAQPDAWLRGVSEGGSEKPCLFLSGSDQATEYLLMGLRLGEGISLERYADLAGQGIDAARIASLEELGMVHQQADRLSATLQGRAVLNAVLRELLPDRS